MKVSLTISAILCAVLLLFAVSLAKAAPALQSTHNPADDWARVQKVGRLIIGTSADYPPFELYNSNYEFDGFDIALAKALGEQLGVEVVFNDYAFDGLIDQVRLGNIDAAMAAISVTSERRELVDFTNLYYIGSSAVVAGPTFTQTVTAPADMAGLTVGVQSGTTYQAWAQQNLVDTGYIAQANLIPYRSVRDMFTDLRTGKVDVGLVGKLTADLAVRGRGLTMVGEGLSAQQFAIAVPKGSSLIEPLNKALLALQADGQFAELSKLYLAETPAPNAPTAGGAVVSLLPTATPTPPAAATPAPTATPACIYSMKWIADLNLDDKNMAAPPILIPGQDFSKGWRLQNDGTCAWSADFSLTYANGNRIEAAMGGTSVKVGKAVQPGEQIDLNVNLRAPQTYGVFQGFWRMHDDQNQAFGEVIWVGIQVPDPNPPTPTAPPVTVATPIPQQPTTSINPNLRADSAYIAANQCTTLRWDVDNIRAIYFIDGGNQQGVGGHDARNVCPGATTTYTLRVVGNDGGTHDFPLTINVSGNADYSINFWVDRDNIDAGKCTTLRWDVRNVRAVYLDNEGVAGVSQREVCPGDTRTYRLAITKNDGGQDSRQVTIRVNNSQPQQSGARIRRFNVDRNMTFIGECITLDWRTDDAEGVGIERNGATILQAGPGNGSYQDCYGPVGVNEYDLIAYNRVGTDRQSLTVVVQDAGD
ncbi:MAG: transporter substrate-binding domain-containing protein [Caldilineaceae bacterium]